MSDFWLVILLGIAFLAVTVYDLYREKNGKK